MSTTPMSEPTVEIRIRPPWRGRISQPVRIWFGHDEHAWVDLFEPGAYEITGEIDPQTLTVTRLSDDYDSPD